MSRRYLVIALALGGCGEPILKNAPAPNPAAVAGIAAAAAAAITLAQPDKKPEAKKADPDDRGVEVKETVPGDVFDRLERAPAKKTPNAVPPANPPEAGKTKAEVPADPVQTPPAKRANPGKPLNPSAPGGAPARPPVLTLPTSPDLDPRN